MLPQLVRNLNASLRVNTLRAGEEVLVRVVIDQHGWVKPTSGRQGLVELSSLQLGEDPPAAANSRPRVGGNRGAAGALDW